MKLLELKQQLETMNKIAFRLPDGQLVPEHFHVTEIGKITKHFIDCGGTVRLEERANLQLWSANDFNHRLHPEKLLSIIELSEDVLGLENLEIEIEYQGDTIRKYGLDSDGRHLLLTVQNTDCLAKDQCGIPKAKPKLKLSDLNKVSCCTPDSNCC